MEDQKADDSVTSSVGGLPEDLQSKTRICNADVMPNGDQLMQIKNELNENEKKVRSP